MLPFPKNLFPKTRPWYFSSTTTNFVPLILSVLQRQHHDGLGDGTTNLARHNKANSANLGAASPFFHKSNKVLSFVVHGCHVFVTIRYNARAQNVGPPQKHKALFFDADIKHFPCRCCVEFVVVPRSSFTSSSYEQTQQQLQHQYAAWFQGSGSASDKSLRNCHCCGSHLAFLFVNAFFKQLRRP